ncbi:hypothetical protein EDD15DRAFT_2370720 [Pisolithus albus]|nr:hypothetical protein EDD15DRAFT_2370720 [Pisolithus albus]
MGSAADTAIKPSSGDLPVTSGRGRTLDINSSTSVVDGNLVAFGNGVSKDQKTAVEQSSLYAQFVANAKYNRVSQTPDWYREYLGALAVCGWVGQGSKWSSLPKAGANASVDRAILSLIEGRYSQKEACLAKTALDVLGGPDGIEGYDLLRQGTWNNSVDQCLVSVAEIDNKDLVLCSTCHNYVPEVINSDVLFFHFIKEDTLYGYELNELVLDQNAWDKTKDAIESKVEGFAGRYIKEISVKRP